MDNIRDVLSRGPGPLRNGGVWQRRTEQSGEMGASELLSLIRGLREGLQATLGSETTEASGSSGPSANPQTLSLMMGQQASLASMASQQSGAAGEVGKATPGSRAFRTVDAFRAVFEGLGQAEGTQEPQMPQDTFEPSEAAKRLLESASRNGNNPVQQQASELENGEPEFVVEAREEEAPSFLTQSTGNTPIRRPRRSRRQNPVLQQGEVIQTRSRNQGAGAEVPPVAATA